MAVDSGDRLPLVRYWVGAVSIWLALGVSLGWYYTFTYYGRSGWPMPLFEACAALILYYFSVLNIATEGQAIHWLLVFPIAGILWSACLVKLSRSFKCTPPALSRAVFLLSLASIPLVLPVPFMCLIAAQTNAGLSLERMMLVALRRGGVEPAWWLTPLYFGLGLVGLGMEVVLYRRLFALRGRRAVLHVLASAIALILAASLVGAVLSVPLRIGFE